MLSLSHQNKKITTKTSVMKHLVLILTFVGSLFFSTTHAAGINMSPDATQSFESAFLGAKDVTWEQIGVLYKASFVLDGQHKAAFYNAEGDLIAVTKNIAPAQLPKALRATLKMNGMWISDVFVLTVEGDDTYYVKYENADTAVTLKSAGAKKWTVYQKAEK